MTDKEILKAFNRRRKEEQEKAVQRPIFTLCKELLFLLFGIAICVILITVTVHYRASFSGWQLEALLCAEVIASFLFQIKNILLLLIFLYQRFAPASVRSVCLFTPSCSEYMRLAVLKYGACKGFIKGLRRLRKCHPPNGGIDEP